MTVKLTISISPEDSERLMQAFKDGKLAELGILDVKPGKPGLPDATEKKWTGTENERLHTPQTRGRATSWIKTGISNPISDTQPLIRTVPIPAIRTR